MYDYNVYARKMFVFLSLPFLRGRILGHNWEKSLYEVSSLLFTLSQSPLLTDFHPPPSKSGLKLVCGNLKSENSQDYAQKPQQNCTFINSASEKIVVSFIVEVGHLWPL
jgi:hypothetical protein